MVRMDAMVRNEILTFEDAPAERVWRHGAHFRWVTPLDDAPPQPGEERECKGCLESLPVYPHVEFELHSEYARSGPCARTLARAWHTLALEEHPEWKAWEDCSEAYRSALQARFLRLMNVGMIQ